MTLMTTVQVLMIMFGATICLKVLGLDLSTFHIIRTVKVEVEVIANNNEMD